ncbi:ovomucoid-like [Uranotaenia lowii]|uniref:ovomucoid-like n=1 Tax=Uranotaenia lowii TaxID=190385 RepID=UPI0024792DC4|nr:ovomucoid-like [Uranotaenia lowii]
MKSFILLTAVLCTISGLAMARRTRPSATGEWSCPACPYDYTPICGSDGVTYANDCVRFCSASPFGSVAVAYSGECIGAPVETIPTGEYNCPACPYDYTPICGSDGLTYSNDCVRYCSASPFGAVAVAHAGECP